LGFPEDHEGRRHKCEDCFLSACIYYLQQWESLRSFCSVLPWRLHDGMQLSKGHALHLHHLQWSVALSALHQSSQDAMCTSPYIFELQTLAVPGHVWHALQQNGHAAHLEFWQAVVASPSEAATHQLWHGVATVCTCLGIVAFGIEVPSASKALIFPALGPQSSHAIHGH